MTESDATLKPLFDHSESPEYIGDELEVAESDREEFSECARELVCIARNLVPPGYVEDTIPTVTSFSECPNDFADFTVSISMEGPSGVPLANDKWHASNGYLMEMLGVTPAVSGDVRTHTQIRLRVFQTALDDDPLALLRDWPNEAHPTVDAFLDSVRRNMMADARAFVLKIQYYFAEGDN